MDTTSFPPTGAFLDADGRCLWRVWAPFAQAVSLVLSDADGRETRHAMRQESSAGYFVRELAGIGEGQFYAFALDNKIPRPDPASRRQLKGVHAPSAVWSADRHAWGDQGWQGIPRGGLTIYELHVGAFTPEGTFAAIIPRLQALRELGITAIELMPVAPCPGRWNWGYDGVYWYAVEENYGGPRELQRLVDASHQAGIAVYLDVVFNHLGPEGNYLGEYGPYFTPRHGTPWGPALNFDDRHGEHVRSFVLHSVRQWIRDFHFDGLRLDAIHMIFDHSDQHILAEIKQVADEAAAASGRPVVHIISESSLCDVNLLLPMEHGGLGHDSQWNDDFHHAVHTLITGERAGYYAPYTDPANQLVDVLNHTFRHDGSFCSIPTTTGAAATLAGDQFVISIQTHDQVGNRAHGERLTSLVGPSALRLAASLMLLAPYTPMLFMGEEYGERHPFPFFCDFGDPRLRKAVQRGRLAEFSVFGWTEIPTPHKPATFESARLAWDWSAPEQAGLRRLYADLLNARQSWPTLRNFSDREAQLVDQDGATLLRLRRGSLLQPADVIVVWFNLGETPSQIPDAADRDLKMIWSSEATKYGGAASAPITSHQWTLAPFECVILAPELHLAAGLASFPI